MLFPVSVDCLSQAFWEAVVDGQGSLRRLVFHGIMVEGRVAGSVHQVTLEALSSFLLLRWFATLIAWYDLEKD